MYKGIKSIHTMQILFWCFIQFLSLFCYFHAISSILISKQLCHYGHSGCDFWCLCTFSFLKYLAFVAIFSSLKMNVVFFTSLNSLCILQTFTTLNSLIVLISASFSSSLCLLSANFSFLCYFSSYLDFFILSASFTFSCKFIFVLISAYFSKRYFCLFLQFFPPSFSYFS